MSSRLSLWAMPGKGTKNERGWIQASSEACSMVSLASVPITPHITLASWTRPYPDVILDQFVKRAPFRLKPFPRVHTDDSYWMCIFCEMTPTPDISRLRELAQAIRPDIRSGTYRPHASLVYGNVDDHTKLMVARAMDCFVPATFACERVCLVDTSEQDHTKWTIIAEAKLEGNAWAKAHVENEK